MSDSVSLHLAGFGRPRSRLTSASPLAGRGFPFDIESLNGIGLEEDNYVYGDFDLSHYLQTEVDGDGNVMVRDDEDDSQTRTRAHASQGNSQPRLTHDQLLQSSLDQESVNFLDFMYAQTLDLPAHELEVETQEETGTKKVNFSTLLPPKETTRTVATHALMHILTLATKGFLGVRQDEYEDQSNEEYGTFYRFGEIQVQLPAA